MLRTVQMLTVFKNKAECEKCMGPRADSVPGDDLLPPSFGNQIPGLQKRLEGYSEFQGGKVYCTFKTIQAYCRFLFFTLAPK